MAQYKTVQAFFLASCGACFTSASSSSVCLVSCLAVLSRTALCHCPLAATCGAVSDRCIILVRSCQLLVEDASTNVCYHVCIYKVCFQHNLQVPLMSKPAYMFSVHYCTVWMCQSVIICRPCFPYGNWNQSALHSWPHSLERQAIGGIRDCNHCLPFHVYKHVQGTDFMTLLEWKCLGRDGNCDLMLECLTCALTCSSGWTDKTPKIAGTFYMSVLNMRCTVSKCNFDTRSVLAAL